jgi:hypothetical protein
MTDTRATLTELNDCRESYGDRYVDHDMF